MIQMVNRGGRNKSEHVYRKSNILLKVRHQQTLTLGELALPRREKKSPAEVHDAFKDEWVGVIPRGWPWLKWLNTIDIHLNGKPTVK